MAAIKRTFYPGDEWLFIKIYTGINTADILLSSIIPKVIAKMRHQGLIDNWFFIRYTDPNFHIRLRLHLTNIKHVGPVLSQLRKILNVFVSDHLISSIVIDTYKREIERYGRKTMESSEQMFSADSECVCALLNVLRDKDANYRWKCAVWLIDGLLEALSMSISEKSNLLEKLSLGYKKEFGYNEHNSKPLNALYHRYKSQIEQLLQYENDNQIMSDTYRLICNRNKRINTISQHDRKYRYNNSALLHMSMNRLFQTQSRLNELIIYTFLSKAYKSMLIRRQNFREPP